MTEAKQKDDKPVEMLLSFGFKLRVHDRGQPSRYGAELVGPDGVGVHLGFWGLDPHIEFPMGAPDGLYALAYCDKLEKLMPQIYTVHTLQKICRQLDDVSRRLDALEGKRA